MTLLLRSRNVQAALLATVLLCIFYSFAPASSFPKYIHTHLSRPTVDGSQLIDITRSKDAFAGLETPPTEPSPSEDPLPTIDGDAPIPTFVHEIMTYNSTNYARLTCPPTIGARYSALPLRPSSAPLQYFFSLNPSKTDPLPPPPPPHEHSHRDRPLPRPLQLRHLYHRRPLRRQHLPHPRRPPPRARRPRHPLLPRLH